MQRLASLIIILFFIINNNKADSEPVADTISLSLQQAEDLFLKNNYTLLAAKYQINEAEAEIVQAKLWDNPSFNIDKEAYNRPSGKWFVIPGGEYAISAQQLIYLAGKRDKRINIAKYSSHISQYQFYDLVRTLKYELRSGFYELYFLRQSLSTYEREIKAIRSVVIAYTNEYQKGNIPFREVARLQALQFSLENEKISLLKNVSERQNDLVMLTGDSLSRHIQPVLDLASLEELNPSLINLSQAISQGIANRSDLKIAEAQIQSEQTNLGLQKAMRIPDISLGANYDRVGGYIPDYNSVSLSFNLPLWNQNQGNIRMSKNRIEEMKVIKNQKELEVKSEITKDYIQLMEIDSLYKSSPQKFDNNYEKLFDGIAAAYQNHSISLLEFIDYYETYKNSKNEYYQLQYSRINAIEELNMATGTTIIK